MQLFGTLLPFIGWTKIYTPEDELGDRILGEQEVELLLEHGHDVYYHKVFMLAWFGWAAIFPLGSSEEA